MITFAQYYKKSATYKVFSELAKEAEHFTSTIGQIAQMGIRMVKRILIDGIEIKELFAQCERFGISSLPITLSIVGMTSIIVSSLSDKQ